MTGACERELPIMFKPEMVQAILEGRKTQTRRLSGLEVINQSPAEFFHLLESMGPKHRQVHCFENMTSKIQVDARPRYNSGDLLWVKESIGGKNSMFMFKADARLWLRVTAVRAERLGDIRDDDAKAEGAVFFDGRPVNHHGWRMDQRDVYPTPRQAFLGYFATIHGVDVVESNPWVWVYTFEQTEAQHGA